MRLLQKTFFVILYLISFTLKAEIELPSIFSDHMVLQQQSQVAIWGKASSRKSVQVVTSWNGEKYIAKANDDGCWKLKVKTPMAGGPYEITISGDSVIHLRDVLIGEVWLCSGQSNMEMPMKGFHNQPVAGSNEAILKSENKSIRLFPVNRAKSLERLDDFEGEWKECIPTNVSNFSAVAYFYGKMLQQALGVPVGLICSNWGGTRIEPWISEDGIKEIEWLTLPDKKSEKDFSEQVPTVLFNAMINPIVDYAIKGVVWYQGESNRDEPDRYQKLLLILIKNWRKEWSVGEFPFYYVQIAPYDYSTVGLNSAELREAQYKVTEQVPNVGMACILDIGEKNYIHPPNKKDVGTRLAYLALAKTYNFGGFEYSGPVLKEMTVDGSLVKLTFNHASNGLTSFGKELENFKVAGENKRFYKAKAFITNIGVTLFSPSVEEPVAVRYAFENFVVGDLFNTEGLPVSSFRTDDWE